MPEEIFFRIFFFAGSDDIFMCFLGLSREETVERVTAKFKRPHRLSFFTFFFLFYLRRFPKHRTEKKLSLGLTLKIMCLALCSQPIDPHDIIFHNNIYPPAVDDNNKK